MRFEQRVVVISGAGSGIGRASALQFAAEGAQVGGWGYRSDPPGCAPKPSLVSAWFAYRATLPMSTMPTGWSILPLNTLGAWMCWSTMPVW